MLNALTTTDLVAIAVFVLSWLVFEVVCDHSPLRKYSLSGHMAESRQQWMKTLADRELRMVDTQILSGLQQGAAFFASTSILAIGGCFALLGSTETVTQIYSDLPIPVEFSRAAWEAKALGLAVLFAYAFFKFGWSYRLFNYCSILIGAVPHATGSNQEECRREAKKAADMNIIAGRHFTSGLRGMFFALGYLGWFVGPTTFIIATVCVLLVLTRRQFFSHAKNVLSK